MSNRPRLLYGAITFYLLMMPISVAYLPLGERLVPRFTASWLSWSYVQPGLYLSDIGVVAVLIAGLFDIYHHRAHSSLWHSRPFHWFDWCSTVPLLLIGLLTVVTLPLALSFEFASYSAMRWLGAIGVYLALIRAAMPMAYAVAVLMVNMSIQTLVGISQIVHHGQDLGIPGAKVVPGFVRAFGLMVDPNVFGGFLCITLLVGLPLTRMRRWRFIWWFLWMGLSFSFSRSAWLATAIIFPVVLFILAWRFPLQRRHLVHIMVGAVVVVATAQVIGNTQTIQRVQETMSQAHYAPSILREFDLAALYNDYDDAEIPDEPDYRTHAGRLFLAWAGIRSLIHSPLGIGAGNFPALPYFAIDGFYPNYAHNLFLLFATELGIFGGILWAWMCGANVGLLGSRWVVLNPWAIVTLSAWGALVVISFFDGYLWALESGRLFTVTLLAWMHQSMTGMDTSSLTRHTLV